MKAYKVYDRMGYSLYSVVVFADSYGKAKALALGTDEFPSCDWDYTELSARRVPSLDKYYHGNRQLDWYDDEDKLVLIKEAGYECDEDSFDPDDCEICVGKEYCSRYQEYIEDEISIAGGESE